MLRVLGKSHPHEVMCKRMRTLCSQLSPCSKHSRLHSEGSVTQNWTGSHYLELLGLQAGIHHGVHISKNSLWDNRNTNSWLLIKCLKPQVRVYVFLERMRQTAGIGSHECVKVLRAGRQAGRQGKSPGRVCPADLPLLQDISISLTSSVDWMSPISFIQGHFPKSVKNRK